MKKVILSLAVIFVSLFTANAVGKTESFDCKDFTGLSFSGGFDVDIVKSDTYSVEVEASDDLMPYVSVVCKNNILSVKFDKLPIKLRAFKKDSPKVRIAMPTLNSLVVSGACDVKSDDTFTTSGMARFSVMASGASDVYLGIKAVEVVVSASGASDVSLSGESGDLDVKVSGASDFDGLEMVSDDAKITASGASDVSVYVNKRLTVSLSGASSCVYMGSNQIQLDVKNVSGASSFKRL